MLDGKHRVVLADDHHRLEPALGSWLHNRNRRGEVENPGRIKRIAIHSNHVLLVDRRGLANVQELAEATLLDISVKGHVGLGTDKVVHRHHFCGESYSGDPEGDDDDGENDFVCSDVLIHFLADSFQMIPRAELVFTRIGLNPLGCTNAAYHSSQARPEVE